MKENVKKMILALSVINCPNCGGSFYPVEKSQNLSNIRCKDCYLEAVFHDASDQRYNVLGMRIPDADIDPVLSHKMVLPPFIFYRTWISEGTDIKWETADFYPFVPYKSLNKPDPLLTFDKQNDTTVVYFTLEDLPSVRIYTSPTDEELAELISRWDKLSTERVQVRFQMGYARSARLVDIARALRQKRGIIDEEVDETEEE